MAQPNLSILITSLGKEKKEILKRIEITNQYKFTLLYSHSLESSLFPNIQWPFHKDTLQCIGKGHRNQFKALESFTLPLIAHLFHKHHIDYPPPDVQHRLRKQAIVKVHQKLGPGINQTVLIAESQKPLCLNSILQKDNIHIAFVGPDLLQSSHCLVIWRVQVLGITHGDHVPRTEFNQLEQTRIQGVFIERVGHEGITVLWLNFRKELGDDRLIVRVLGVYLIQI